MLWWVVIQFKGKCQTHEAHLRLTKPDGFWMY